MDIHICDSPIFVVGAPRSGTSMMQWALRQHPHLWGGQESDYLVPLIKGLRESFEFGRARGKLHWLSGQGVTWAEFLKHMGYGVNALYTERSGGRRWIEQTPQYTLHLDEIVVMFPSALFVMMLRDGRDVVHSLRHFVKPQSHEQACKTWARHVEYGLTFARSSPHSSRLLVVKYEDVVEDPEGQLRNVYSFIGETYDPASASFIRDKPRINSSFDEAARDSAGQGWASWSEHEVAVFNRIAGAQLEEAGFGRAV